MTVHKFAPANLSSLGEWVTRKYNVDPIIVGSTTDVVKLTLGAGNIVTVDCAACLKRSASNVLKGSYFVYFDHQIFKVSIYQSLKFE